MHWQLPLAASDLEGLIWLVVMGFVVVGQIMKFFSGRKGEDGGSVVPGQPRAPEQEIQDFLKGLMEPGGSSPKMPPIVSAKPKPNGQPVQKSAVPMTMRHNRESGVRPTVANVLKTVLSSRNRSPVAVVGAALPKPARTIDPSASVPVLPAAASGVVAGADGAARSQRSAEVLSRLFKNRDFLQNAVVLKEIMDPPVALRHGRPL